MTAPSGPRPADYEVMELRGGETRLDPIIRNDPLRICRALRDHAEQLTFLPTLASHAFESLPLTFSRRTRPIG